MTNGDAVGIVEVKYKAHENDLDKLDRRCKTKKSCFLYIKTTNNTVLLLHFKLMILLKERP
jgi:hypothetical protein